MNHPLFFLGLALALLGLLMLIGSLKGSRTESFFLGFIGPIPVFFKGKGIWPLLIFAMVLLAVILLWTQPIHL